MNTGLQEELFAYQILSNSLPTNEYQPPGKKVKQDCRALGGHVPIQAGNGPAKLSKRACGFSKGVFYHGE